MIFFRKKFAFLLINIWFYEFVLDFLIICSIIVSMKLPLNKYELYTLYKERVDKLAEDNELVTIINSDMVAAFISKILFERGVYIDPEKIDEVYSNKIHSLNLTPEQWREEYANNVPKIIHLIHEQIEEKLKPTPIDAAKEIEKTLKEELDKVWAETPIGYNEDNNAYHMGNGLMVTKETWDKYQTELSLNSDLNPFEFVVKLMKEYYSKNDSK